VDGRLAPEEKNIHMKYNVVALLILFILNSVIYGSFAAQKIDCTSANIISEDSIIKDIPVTKNGSLPSYYKFVKKNEGKLNLSNLENGVDSIEIRIWFGYSANDTAQAIIIKNIRGNWESKILTLEDKRLGIGDANPVRIINSKKITPKNGWNNFIESLFKLKINTLPDKRYISNYPDIIDGSGVIFEIASPKSYRIYNYVEPGMYQNMIPQAKLVSKIILALETELDFTPIKNL